MERNMAIFLEVQISTSLRDATFFIQSVDFLQKHSTSQSVLGHAHIFTSKEVRGHTLPFWVQWIESRPFEKVGDTYQ